LASFPGVALFSLASDSGFFTVFPRSLMDRAAAGPHLFRAGCERSSLWLCRSV
jgi:hypothetical protein